MSENKANILTAASELFAETGAEGLSVRAISRRAGLSTMGIYNHFNGKQGILDALYIEGFQMVMRAIDVDDVALSPRAVVLHGLSNYIELAAEHRGHYQLIFGRGDPSYTPSSAAIAVGEEAFNRLTALVSRAIPAHLGGFLEQRKMRRSGVIGRRDAHQPDQHPGIGGARRLHQGREPINTDATLLRLVACIDLNQDIGRRHSGFLHRLDQGTQELFTVERFDDVEQAHRVF